MKKAVILLLLAISIPAISQQRDSLKVASLTSSDSIWTSRIETKTPVTVTWEFTDLDANDATLEVFYGDIDETTGDTILISVNRSRTFNKVYPITLDKTNSHYYSIKGNDTINLVGVEKDNWPYDLVAVKLNKGSVTSGSVIQRVEK